MLLEESILKKMKTDEGEKIVISPLLCLSLSLWEMGRSLAGVRRLNWAGGNGMKEDGGHRAATNSAGVSPHPRRPSQEAASRLPGPG